MKETRAAADARRERDRKETEARMNLESATFAAREAGLDAEDVLDTVTGASEEFDADKETP